MSYSVIGLIIVHNTTTDVISVAYQLYYRPGISIVGLHSLNLDSDRTYYALAFLFQFLVLYVYFYFFVACVRLS